MVAAHGGKFAGSQVIERQVNGAATAVARLGGHISFFEHLRPLDVRVVPSFRPVIHRLLRPAQEAIYGALRAIAVPEKQAEAEGCGLFSRAFKGCAQSPRADNPICRISVHGRSEEHTSE